MKFLDPRVHGYLDYAAVLLVGGARRRDLFGRRTVAIRFRWG